MTRPLNEAPAYFAKSFNLPDVVSVSILKILFYMMYNKGVYVIVLGEGRERESER